MSELMGGLMLAKGKTKRQWTRSRPPRAHENCSKMFVLVANEISNNGPGHQLRHGEGAHKRGSERSCILRPVHHLMMRV